MSTQFKPGQSGNPDGLPSTYDPAYAEQARKMCRLGATDNDLVDFFEISRATLYRWKTQFEEFADAIVDGKERADERVRQALYNKATGYSFDSEKIFCQDGVVIRAKTVEHVPPSDSAIKFWLMNRQGWSDKVGHELTGRDGAAIQAEVTVEAVLKALPLIQDEC